MDRRLIVVLALVAACSRGDASSGRAAGATSHDSAAGNVATAAAGDSAHTAAANAGAVPSAPAASPNQLGRIPVLEYHIIGAEKNELYKRTEASFRADMEAAYKLGYRPITIA